MDKVNLCIHIFYFLQCVHNADIVHLRHMNKGVLQWSPSVGLVPLCTVTVVSPAIDIE